MNDIENPRVPQQGGDRTDESLDLLTVSEVAAMLRLSKMTIYRLMEKGQLTALRVGRSFRIPRDSVKALLEESTKPS
jgi:excisionase family DNA binding protein